MKCFLVQGASSQRKPNAPVMPDFNSQKQWISSCSMVCSAQYADLHSSSYVYMRSSIAGTNRIQNCILLVLQPLPSARQHPKYQKKVHQNTLYREILIFAVHVAGNKLIF